MQRTRASSSHKEGHG